MKSLHRCYQENEIPMTNDGPNLKKPQVREPARYSGALFDDEFGICIENQV
jgi:hypothetical protein